MGLRDYQDAKADVIMKYNSDEARRLKNMGHLPESVNVSSLFLSFCIQLASFQVVDGNEVEDDIFFDNESDEDSGDEIAPQPYQPVIRYISSPLFNCKLLCSSESESDDSDESD